MHLNTLFLVYAGILLACAAALVITWRQNPNELGPRSWAIGSGWASLALVIFSISAFRPELIWLNGSGSPIGWLGLIYYARGTRQFVGLTPTTLWMKSLFVLGVAGISLSILFTPYNPASFIIIGSVVLTVVSFDIVYSALWQADRRNAPSYFIAFFFTAFGVTHTIRGVMTCFDLERTGYARPIDSALIFVGILGGAATVMGFSMLISQRLMNDRDRTLGILEKSVEDLRGQFVALSGGDYMARAELLGDGTPMDVIAGLFNETAEKVGSAFTEIEQQRSLLAVTQKSLLDGLMLIDTDATILSVNPAFLRMLEYVKGDLVGSSFRDLLAEDDKELASSIFATVDVEPIQERATRFLSSAGVSMPLTINATPHRDADYNVQGAVLVVRDDRSLREAQAHLQMTDRLAAIGTVAAGVAHEINNPLSYVISNLEYAVEELQEAEGSLSPDIQAEMLTALTAAQGGGERVRKIVLDLKSFSRQEEESIGQVQVNSLIESAVAMLNNELRHHARLELDLGKLPEVRGSEAKLGQVFLNLIHNAAQSIEAGHVEDNLIRVVSRVDAGEVVVEISDTGCGIPELDRKRIFDTFYTTKPAGVGTGLGLAICHRAVTDLDGRIHVTSTVGEGSTFHVSLPTTPMAQRRKKSGIKSVVGGAETTRRRVLIIDDEEEVGNSAMRILGKAHYVEAVTSAREAMGRLRSTHYDVVLCDVMMPDMTGMQFFEELKANHPDVVPCVVFMSGGTFSSEAEEFLKQLARPALAKPFTKATLRAAIAADKPSASA